MLKLWVDDKRQAPEGWTLCRSITEAVRLLKGGFVESLSLDHDIEYIEFWPKDRQEDFTPVLEYAVTLPENLRPSHFYCHSGNDNAYLKYEQILLKALGLKLEPLTQEIMKELEKLNAPRA